MTDEPADDRPRIDAVAFLKREAELWQMSGAMPARLLTIYEQATGRPYTAKPVSFRAVITGILNAEFWPRRA